MISVVTLMQPFQTLCFKTLFSYFSDIFDPKVTTHDSKLKPDMLKINKCNLSKVNMICQSKQ